jgi:hypothetical protein
MKRDTVAQVNRHRLEGQPDRPATVPYAASGHPSIEQLMAEQGTGPIVLHGDFWPEIAPHIPSPIHRSANQS